MKWCKYCNHCTCSYALGTHVVCSSSSVETYGENCLSHGKLTSGKSASPLNNHVPAVFPLARGSWLLKLGNGLNTTDKIGNWRQVLPARDMLSFVPSLFPMLTDIYKDFLCLRMTLLMIVLRHMPLEMHHAIRAPSLGLSIKPSYWVKWSFCCRKVEVFWLWKIALVSWGTKIANVHGMSKYCRSAWMEIRKRRDSHEAGEKSRKSTLLFGCPSHQCWSSF